jgi:hypothetical protein
MNVLRRILYTAAAFAGLTVLAIVFTPDISFISYVPEALGLGFGLLILLSALSMYKEGDLTLHDKNTLMNGFLVVVLFPSFFTAGAFLHESQTSWSGGEIHWHADYEVIVQNESGELERLDLIDPSEFCESDYMCAINDRTGITEYHEHNDNRIHLEGVFKEREDATLRAYFNTFGGELTNDKLVYPTNDGTFRDETRGNKTLKIFVQAGVGGDREWKRIEQPGDYVISPYKRGPNMDNIFIVYDDTPPEDALEDLKTDDRYKGFDIQKSGEGF